MIRYDAICQAIAAVVEVDEVKPIRDQILVLQLYAEQARIIRIVLGGSLVNAAADGEGEGGRK
ncbi:MAG: hypothetical protein ACJ8AW_22260 [Rhodopila sp.]